MAITFCIISMYYWFVLYSKRTEFSLPCTTESEFNLYAKQSYYISQYLNLSSVAVVLLCIKNLRILNIYFPAFGVLFDTFRRAKIQLFFFVIMCAVFMVAFMFAGNILFGPQLGDYMSIGRSFMSLFQMLVGDYRYKTLY